MVAASITAATSARVISDIGFPAIGFMSSDPSSRARFVRMYSVPVHRCSCRGTVARPQRR